MQAEGQCAGDKSSDRHQREADGDVDHGHTPLGGEHAAAADGVHEPGLDGAGLSLAGQLIAADHRGE